jgi:nucleotide-binding universal stress UspA family protein
MRVLLATDMTPTSAGAVHVAIGLCADLGTSVRVLRAVENVSRYRPAPGYGVPIPEPDPLEETKRGVLRRLDQWLARFDGRTARWPRSVEIGPAVPTILRAAEAERASLILMGQGAHDLVARWSGAETALRTARLSRVPVLAVAANARERPRVLLAGVDFSGLSREALVAALPLLEPGGEVHLVHVIWRATSDDSPLADEWFAVHRQRAREQLAAWGRELEPLTSARIHLHVLEGDIAKQILQLSGRIGADLLVVGREGSGTLGRLLLGSISTRLLREAHCSLLVVPPPLPSPGLRPERSVPLAARA